MNWQFWLLIFKQRIRFAGWKLVNFVCLVKFIWNTSTVYGCHWLFSKTIILHSCYSVSIMHKFLLLWAKWIRWINVRGHLVKHSLILLILLNGLIWIEKSGISQVVVQIRVHLSLLPFLLLLPISLISIHLYLIFILEFNY